MPHHKSFGKLRAEVKWKQKGKPRFVNFLGLCCLEILQAKVSSTWASTKQICPCLYSSVVVTKPALDYLHQSPLLLLCHSWSCDMTLRVTLDEGPRSRDQWIQAILMVKSFKWVPRHLDEGPRPKSGELRLNLHGTCFGGKINWFRPKNSAKRRAPNLEKQESGYEPRYSPTQGFNLLQISPNWFLGNRTLDPHQKWASV
jgi:hypothetical protein